MAHFTPPSDDLPALWRRARARLRLVDLEPPLERGEVDPVLEALGPRHPGEGLGSWLKRAGRDVAARPVADLLSFDSAHHRFVAVAGFSRLAADTATGPVPALPERDLETADGRFRLRIAKIGTELEILVQALGHASDAFADRLLGLSAGTSSLPFVVFKLDEDGDGVIRIADTADVRSALLQPVIGLVEDL